MKARIALALLIVAPLLMAQFGGTPRAKASARPSWDPETAMFVRKGCVGCHKFTGVREAAGIQGPDLTKVKTRLTRVQIRDVLRDPHQTFPDSPMPELDLSNRELDLLVRFLTRQKPTPGPSVRPQAKPTVLVFKGYRNVTSGRKTGKRKKGRSWKQRR